MQLGRSCRLVQEAYIDCVKRLQAIATLHTLVQRRLMPPSVAPLAHSTLSAPTLSLSTDGPATRNNMTRFPLLEAVAFHVAEMRSYACARSRPLKTLHPRDGFEGHHSESNRARDRCARTWRKLGRTRADESERRNSATRGCAIFLRLASFLAGPSLLAFPSTLRSSRTDLPYQLSSLINLPWPGSPGPLPDERCVAIIRSFSASQLSSLAPFSSAGTVSPSPPPATTPCIPSAPFPSTVSAAVSATLARNAVSSSGCPPFRLPQRAKLAPRRGIELLDAIRRSLRMRVSPHERVVLAVPQEARRQRVHEPRVGPVRRARLRRRNLLCALALLLRAHYPHSFVRCLIS